MTTSIPNPKPDSVPAWVSPLQRVINVAGASAALVGHVLERCGRLVSQAALDSADVAEQLSELGLSTAGAARELRTLVEATPRVARLAGEALRVAGSYELLRRRCALAGVTPHPDDLEAVHRANAERLYRLCVEQQGALIKVGQLASSRVDLLPKPYVEALSRLQDSLPPHSTDAIVERIEHELATTLDEAFAAFEREPLATASVAQVHGARLHDGRRVVVKVRLPGVAQRFEADLRALRLVARVLSERFPDLSLMTVADSLAESIAAELDFEREATQLEAVASVLRGVDDVHVPARIESHSTGRVLTTTRFDGERLVPFLEACEASEAAGAKRRDRVFEALIHAFCVQILEHGTFHADPHPGNFLVLSGPELGVVDFGCVVQLTDEQRGGYSRLMQAIIAGDAGQMAHELGELGFNGRDGEGEPADRARFAARFLALFHADLLDFSRLDPADQLDKALTLIREEARLSVPHHFVLLARVLTALSGLVIRFRPDVRLAEIGWRSLTRSLAAA